LTFSDSRLPDFSAGGPLPRRKFDENFARMTVAGQKPELERPL
jgi:hypothetical protein